MFILLPGSSFAVVFRKDGIPCRYMEQKKSIQIDNSFKNCLYNLAKSFDWKVSPEL